MTPRCDCQIAKPAAGDTHGTAREERKGCSNLHVIAIACRFEFHVCSVNFSSLDFFTAHKYFNVEIYAHSQMGEKTEKGKTNWKLSIYLAAWLAGWLPCCLAGCLPCALLLCNTAYAQFMRPLKQSALQVPRALASAATKWAMRWQPIKYSCYEPHTMYLRGYSYFILAAKQSLWKLVTNKK